MNLPTMRVLKPVNNPISLGIISIKFDPKEYLSPTTKILGCCYEKEIQYYHKVLINSPKSSFSKPVKSPISVGIDRIWLPAFGSIDC